MNAVLASDPSTETTLNLSLMCILEKSPVRSWTVTSTVLPRTNSGSAEGVSPISASLNIRGAWILYHSFAFHLSLTLRPAETFVFFAGAIIMTPLTEPSHRMIVLKGYQNPIFLNGVKKSHSQTVFHYHNKDIFILKRMVPLLFKIHLQKLRFSPAAERRSRGGRKPRDRTSPTTSHVHSEVMKQGLSSFPLSNPMCS